MKSVCFVVSTPFAVNAFLLGHLKAMSAIYRVSLCVNLDAYPLSENLDGRVNVIHVPLARKISLFQDIRALWCLLETFRRNNFDAVHSITPKAGLLAMFAALLCSIKHRHHTFTGQIWVARKNFTRTLLKFADYLIVAFATRVFTDSNSQSAMLEREGICKRGAASVLGKGSIAGVDLQRFKPDTYIRKKIREYHKVSEESCIFLFVGRISRDKGVFDLVHSFIKLSNKRRDVVLWIVGPDEEGLQNELQRLTVGTGCRMSWFGQTFEPEHFMSTADVLMLPSYREGFGLVIIEAAACALPALAYKIDGVVDAIVDGKTGLLVPLGDVNGLVDAMEAMAAAPDFRYTLGRKALDRVSKEFADAAITNAWLEFYEKIFFE